MTRLYVLVNVASNQILGYGALTNMRRQRELFRVVYASWKLPYVPDIRIAPRIELVTAARNVGAI